MLLTKKVSNTITNELCKQDYITKEETLLYSYCFDYFFEMIFYFFSILILGYLLDVFWVTIPLRSFVGGIHASSSHKCTIYSYAIYFFCIFLTNHLPFIKNHFILLIFVIELLLLFCFCPVDCHNKRLDNRKKKILKHLCLYTITILFVVFIILFYNNKLYYCKSMCICSTLILLSTILGYFKNVGEEDA